MKSRWNVLQIKKRRMTEETIFGFGFDAIHSR